MRSRCGTPRHGSGSMELERPCRLKDGPHLSGAYIRSLVKHLSSSMPKGATNPKPEDGAPGVGTERRLADKLPDPDETQQEQRRDDDHKAAAAAATPLRKQTRRRVCTSKPYQERLINMAEARREIVAALKFHRAAMKQASEQREDQQIIKSTLQQEIKSPQRRVLLPPPPPPSSSQVPRSHDLYPSSSCDNLNMLFSYFSNVPSSSSNYSLSPVLPISGNPINLTLPSRPLGLNLNLQDFNSIDINLICRSTSSDPQMPSSTSSPPYNSHSAISPMAGMPALMALPSASSAVPPAPVETIEEAVVVLSKPAAAGGGMLHPAMGDEEIAEIRSIGEQHDMEWNDKLSLVTSAWWCNLLETMEVSPPLAQLQGASKEGVVRINGGLGSTSDEVILDNIPSWSSDQQHGADVVDCCLQDASLPCLDMEETEGRGCDL